MYRITLKYFFFLEKNISTCFFQQAMSHFHFCVKRTIGRDHLATADKYTHIIINDTHLSKRPKSESKRLQSEEDPNKIQPKC